MCVCVDIGLNYCITSLHCYYLHKASYVFAFACWFVCLTIGLVKNVPDEFS